MSTPSPPRVIPRPTYREVPWKNGGGTTAEILLEPADAGADRPFDWRVSLATVGGSGPFSVYPGIDRLIVQTAGSAMRLAHPGRGAHELTPLVPYRFAGDWATAAILAGPAQDFNVMIRRGVVAAHASTVRIAAGARWTQRLDAEWVLAFVATGAVYTHATAATTPAGDTLVATGARGLALIGAREAAAPPLSS